MPTTTDQPRHTNRLIHATSPYLLQHAQNPVDWYEWGREAFDKAVNEDKPIFLSIGYAACHWCHVMEHESFENEEVAALMNAHFVNVKVDREERPDVDAVYMQITLAMNRGHGGWPMTVLLTPQRKPFFSGTYFTPEQLMGLLTNVAEAWKEKRELIDEDAGRAQAYLSEWSAGVRPSDRILPVELIDRLATTSAQYFDVDRGGYRSDGNKFPPSMAMELMLRVHRRTGDAALLRPVEVTLDRMADGGIYDHLGGGICRYSTDPDWLVPHFEKMLYDQALVSSIYLDAYQTTGNARYAQVAADIFDYVLADLQSPEGGFYSTRDADSEGLEGAYYIWRVDQVKEVLGEADAALFCEFYDVTEKGNWFEPRGHAPAGPKNILRILNPKADFAEKHRMSLSELDAKLAAWRPKMLAARSQRVAPALDDKVLTGWNGLMIASLAKGGRVLDQPKYTEAAARAARFVLDKLRTGDGRLLRTHRAGQSRLTGYIDDYAFLIEGLLNLYEATFDARWLDAAAALSDLAIKHYYDASGGGFYFTAHDAEALIVRNRDYRDSAIPSGNAVQASNLLRLAIMLDRKDLRPIAESIFKACDARAADVVGTFDRALSAADLFHDSCKEIAIIGPGDAEATRALIRAVYRRYVPNKVVMFSPEAAGDDAPPLLRGKKLIDGKPAAYVCSGYVCKAPVTDPDSLVKLLEAK
ncbi:MAG: thioredoxin domain-containing protein [Phycisphaerales bacterium]|nr:MAG: thioredoxin domain-containing protein [Phycisphaerales bacterium]